MESPLSIRGRVFLKNSKTWHIWGTQNSKFLTLYFGRAAVNKIGMQIVLDADLRLLWNLVWYNDQELPSERCP